VDPLIEKGLSLYNNGDYSNASLAFREAYKKNPAWRLHLNIGRCELLLKNYDLAMEEFSAYLKDGGDEITKERKAYAIEQVQFLTDKVASLTFTETQSFEILVDDVKRASTPMTEPLYVMPGSRRVVLEKDGQQVFEKSVIVQAEEAMPIERPKPEPVAPNVESKPAPASAPTEQLPVAASTQQQIAATPAESHRSPLKPIGITLLAVGSAVLIPGVITGAMYISDKNSLEKECPDANNCGDAGLRTLESIRTYATVANIMLSVGGVLTVTGIVLTVVGHKNSHGHKKDNKVGFAPFMNDHVAGVTVSGRF
jgi:hypothetical protein